jgi:hypothetical protein
MASDARLAQAMIIGQGVLMAASLVGVYMDTPYHRGPNPYAQLAARIRATGQTEVIHRGWTEARLVNLYLPPGPLPRQRVMDHR